MLAVGRGSAAPARPLQLALAAARRLPAPCRQLSAAAAAAPIAAHAWQRPEGVPVGLSLANSLTGGTKEPLVIPDGASGQPLTWYSCGPTVYDAAHLGHARNYLCLDILHRVLTVSAPPGSLPPVSRTAISRRSSLFR